jgi:hypothetical protein
VHVSFHSTQMSVGGSSAATFSGECSVGKRHLCCLYKLESKLVAVFLFLVYATVHRRFVCAYLAEGLHLVQCIYISYIHAFHYDGFSPYFFFSIFCLRLSDFVTYSLKSSSACSVGHNISSRFLSDQLLNYFNSYFH